MGFHPAQPWPDEAQERLPQKRAAKEQRVREGKAHAALVFEGEDCGGWCQFGAPDEVPAGFLYNSALSTHEKLGFARDRKIGRHR
jgi:hypothetical protein